METNDQAEANLNQTSIYLEPDPGCVEKLSTAERSRRLAVPVGEIGLHFWAVKAFKREEIRTLGDVLARDPKFIEALSGVSTKAMDILRKYFRDADVVWGKEMGAVEQPAPAPPVGNKPITTIDLRPVRLPVLICELKLSMQDVLGIPRGLLLPEFLRLMVKMLKKHYPILPLSPAMQLVQPDGRGVYIDVPHPAKRNFHRRMTVLSLMHLAAVEMGLGDGDPAEG